MSPKFPNPFRGPERPVATPEVSAPVERAPHVEVAPVPESLNESPESAPQRPQSVPAPQAVIAAPPKSPELVRVEQVLEEDLADAFVRLSPADQLKFKRAGEQTAMQIVALIARGKATVRKVVALLVKWLKLLPGVNRYFIEQEAKIKADKIIHPQ